MSQRPFPRGGENSQDYKRPKRPMDSPLSERQTQYSPPFPRPPSEEVSKIHHLRDNNTTKECLYRKWKQQRLRKNSMLRLTLGGAALQRGEKVTFFRAGFGRRVRRAVQEPLTFDHP
jgi:hypothetical protein